MKDSAATVLSKTLQRLSVYGLLAIVSLVTGSSSQAYASSRVYELPKEITSDRLNVAIDGKPIAVALAAENYYFLNFDLVKSASISIAAPSED